MLSEHPRLKIKSHMEAIEALEAVRDYLSPPVDSLFEEMLNDALEGRIRLEAMDIQERMLLQHHAKRHIQKAIATLQGLLHCPL
jgi:hypothetical protein